MFRLSRIGYLKIARILFVYALDKAQLTKPGTLDKLETRTPEINASQPPSLPTSAILEYQNKELVKEMLLLEKHLTQGCKIGGKACDCCEKHPITLEGLAQEASGMSSKPVYSEIANWSRHISSMTTTKASESGEYDGKYPELAIELRDMRKKLMAATTEV